MDDSTRRMRTVYDQIAPEYAVRTAEMPPDLVACADRFLAWIDRDALVLDLGCGPGRDMAWMEARGARVIGADLSAGMLAQARGQVRGGLAQMDMGRLAFPSGSFAGVWCDAALLHLPKSAALHALGEMRRVSRLGGLLF